MSLDLGKAAQAEVAIKTAKAIAATNDLISLFIRSAPELYESAS